MSYNWGPNFIVPSEHLRDFSGTVQLREEFDAEILHKELEEMGISGSIVRVGNPWYYRKKKTDTRIKIGESDNSHDNFPVSRDTRKLANGKYEVLGLMHVFVRQDSAEKAIARQSIVEVTVEN
ncbi:MAG: hypothetical protein ABIB93_02385 [Chloroflexota bacterium]